MQRSQYMRACNKIAERYKCSLRLNQVGVEIISTTPIFKFMVKILNQQELPKTRNGDWEERFKAIEPILHEECRKLIVIAALK